MTIVHKCFSCNYSPVDLPGEMNIGGMQPPLGGISPVVAGGAFMVLVMPACLPAVVV